MRVVKWIVGIAAALVVLAVVAVFVITQLVNPNRFKGRVEAAVQGVTGYPFTINGDLDIAWYPWLALRIGPAQLGADEPFLRWQSAAVGAQLIPLIRGRLVISRIRLDGLQVHLRRMADGRTNWDALLAHRMESRESSGATPEIGGVEIHNGSLSYMDERDGNQVSLTDWTFDLDEWQSGKPFSIDTRFVLRAGLSSPTRIPVALRMPMIHMQSTPTSVSIPAFEAQLADARVSGSVALRSAKPLRMDGALEVKVGSLRKLLADLAIGGPRPRDEQALGVFSLAGQWALNDGVLAVKPIGMQLDQTKFGGELTRTAAANPLWTFTFNGDHMDLARYIPVEETDSKPFELPTAALKALRARGVLNFESVHFADAQMKNVRLRFEMADGRLRSIQP